MKKKRQGSAQTEIQIDKRVKQNAKYECGVGDDAHL